MVKKNSNKLNNSDLKNFNTLKIFYISIVSLAIVFYIFNRLLQKDFSVSKKIIPPSKKITTLINKELNREGNDKVLNSLILLT